MFINNILKIKQYTSVYRSKSKYEIMQTCIQDKLNNANNNYLAYLEEEYYYLLNRQPEKVLKYISRKENK